MAQARTDLRIVIEMTERALLADPASLLATADLVRGWGWGIALDDVGAEQASLDLMPLLRPDVIKLDLALIQNDTNANATEVISAVIAEAERTGATILAEGIETEEHLERALAAGAKLGQGWYFGRPGPLPTDHSHVTSIPLLPATEPWLGETPFDIVAATGSVVRSVEKRLLMPMSRHFERQAMQSGSTVVLSAFQEAKHFTPRTSEMYTHLTQTCSLVGAMGAGLPPEPAKGVRGADLAANDELRGEWVVAVLGPHYAGALVAKDMFEGGSDEGRRFEHTTTHNRDLVIRVARSLMRRMLPSGELGA